MGPFEMAVDPREAVEIYIFGLDQIRLLPKKLGEVRRVLAYLVGSPRVSPPVTGRSSSRFFPVTAQSPPGDAWEPTRVLLFVDIADKLVRTAYG